MDELWFKCIEAIEEYVKKMTDDSKIFNQILPNIPQLVENNMHGIDFDPDEYTSIAKYLKAHIPKLLQDLQQSFKELYNDVDKRMNTLYARQLRSFFLADLINPAVCDIAGYVYEHGLICNGSKAMEFTVLNALQELSNKIKGAASLDHKTKREVAYTWGILSRSKPDITQEDDSTISKTLDQLLHSYKEIASKYALTLIKFIDLIREKQLRNEFAHFKETIRDFKVQQRSGNYLNEFLALETNQPLKNALLIKDEVRLLPTMFKSCWEFLRLSNANRQVFLLFLWPESLFTLDKNN